MSDAIKTNPGVDCADMGIHRAELCVLTLFTVVAVLAAGCGGSLPVGQSGVRVLVTAEPKTGYTPDVLAADVYTGRPEVDDATAARRDPFRPLDYRNLSDIVVYLVPEAGSASAPAAKGIDIDAGDASHAGHGVKVSAVGGELRIGNSARSAKTVYLRTESGALSDLGIVAPGGTLSAMLTAPGAMSVYSESDGTEDQKLRDLYVAPNGWVATAVSGGRVTFSPVPPGEYVLHTWHPRLPGTSQRLKLPADRLVETTATVTVNVLPAAN